MSSLCADSVFHVGLLVGLESGNKGMNLGWVRCAGVGGGSCH